MKSYALVDIAYRNIYAVHWDEQAAHEARNTFRSKLNLIVYDLAGFDIDPPEKFYLDDYECLNWHITLGPDILNGFNSLHQTIIRSTLTRQQDHVLINQSIPAMLSQDRRKELRDQIVLYITLITKIIHLDNLELKQKIDDIFFYEIHMCEIQDRLFELATSSICTNINGELIILPAIDRFYE